MRHSYCIRATLRQTGWLPFVGSMDARDGTVRNSTGKDLT